MQTILLAPDSFKGTLSSQEICALMTPVILRHFPSCTVRSIPVADGGEGSTDCFLAAMDGRKIHTRAAGPWFDEIDSFYGLVDGGRTAVIEMAAAAGLPLAERCAKRRCDPSATTTLGVGELVRHALAQGATKLILGLGGSATNDGGCGFAHALGARFWDRDGREFIPVGATLEQIARMDLSGAERTLSGAALTVMCDVDNPLLGEHGAAHTFGPQKGADPDMVRRLDRALAHLARVSGETAKAETPGAGAAGGLGFMAMLLGGRMRPGIETALDAVGFDALLKDAGLVFTGEGRIDGQSLRGKAVLGVARRAQRQGVPVIAVVGDALDEGLDEVYAQGVTAVVTTNRRAVPFEQARLTARQDLTYTMENLLRTLRIQFPGGN